MNRTPVSDDSLILLFIKSPVRGRVKSRLAAALGENAALGLYKNFVLDTLATVELSGHPCRICFHPPDAGEAVADWLGRRRSYLAQTGNDLGERMEQAFRRVFSEGACSRAILIGSDIPDLPGDAFSEAFRSLDRHDAVIGPATDGGYYLIGFRIDTFFPDIFHAVEWSTDTVFSRTMEVFAKAGLRVHALPAWRDVDTSEDLRDLWERNRGTAFRHSRTMNALEAREP